MAADKVQLAQDPDVLDTWFSSGEAGNKIVQYSKLEKAYQSCSLQFVSQRSFIFVGKHECERAGINSVEYSKKNTANNH